MIFILNNVKFGHPKLSKYQLDFFHDNFIPLLLKSGSKEHHIIISGDLFYNTKHTNFQLLLDIKNILNILAQYSKIGIFGNDYCYDLFKEQTFKVVEMNHEIENISLFQLTKDNVEKIGYCVDKNNKLKFIENKFSPRFVEYIIKNIEDIDKIKITKDFIDLHINSELIEKQEYKNKIDIFLNNNNFNNVYYTGEKKEQEKVILDSKNIKIREILVDNIDEDLKSELDEVFVIYDEKINN